MNSLEVVVNMNKDELKELAEQKEREWKTIQEKRIDALELALKQKTIDYDQQREKFHQLKEDFKYNLKLLEERDKELDNIDQNCGATRKQLAEKNSEISELKIKIDELKKCLEKEHSELEDTKKHYLNRLNQKQNDIEQYKAKKDAEINSERNEIEKYKRSLQMQIKDLEYDLEKQRNELKTEFDEVLRKREHEWRKANDELNTEILAKDLQIKLSNNELEQVKDTLKLLQSSNDEIDTNKKVYERKLKEKEWELKDVNSLKDSKINELEMKLHQLEKNNKDKLDDYYRKFEEMDKITRDKESQIQKLKDTRVDTDKRIQLLEDELNEYKMKLKQKNWNIQDLIKEKEEAINSFNEEIIRLKSNVNLDIETHARKTVSQDLTFQECKIENESLKSELELKKKEISNYKIRLQESIEREQEKEMQKIQCDLDWQKRYENLEKTKYESSEEFIQKLSESREKSLSDVKHLEEKLKHKENLINALKSANPALDVFKIETSEFQLKEENEYLKTIIKQMRDEMENLAEKIPTKQIKVNEFELRKLNADYQNNKTQLSDKANIEFTNDLENQLSKLKEKNRELQATIDEYLLKQKFPEKITDNTIINNHIQSLNQTISVLRKEKVELTTFSKKQQTRLLHIEKTSSENSEQLRLKQTQIETLQYELSSQTRRNTTEINNLKQRIADLELELNESRREADEYHKMAIEKNSEITSLDLKISELKVKLSNSGTQVNFGAQELFIQQLQDEIERLNKKLITHGTTSAGDMGGPTVNEINYLKETQSLKTKLKNAAKHISQLIKEKQQLIEMSNQLRAELQKNKQRNDDRLHLRLAGKDNDINSLILPIKELTSHENKLQKLENMQYDITKQQLALAQRKVINSVPNVIFNKTKVSEDALTSASFSSENEQHSISTVKSENLQELWKILDDNAHNSILNSNDEIIKIDGKKTSIYQKENANRKSTINKNQPSVLNSNRTKTKIRNYNIKTD